MKKDKFEVGNWVEIINDSGALPEMLEQGFKKGAVFKIREIGSQNFHRDGGGFRLEGINLWKDLTGYEMCFTRKRFKKVII